jgi:hypothetical protein
MKRSTLLFLLFLVVPGLAQELSPTPNSSVIWSRPTISATFYQDVGPARIWIDGTEFTAFADHHGRTVRLVPPYNLDYGTHRVRVRTNFGGVADWNFQIVQNDNGGNSGGSWNQGARTEVLQFGPAPGSTVTVTRPPIGAIFNGSVKKVQMTVDGVDVTGASRIQSSRITWNPGYDLDQGQHNCVVTAVAPNGQAVRGDWNFIIRSR